MRVRVSSPQEAIFCGDADAVRLRTTGGDVRILKHHVPYLAEIGEGMLEIQCKDAIMLSGKTSGGIVYNHENEISIILFEPYSIG